MAHVLRLLHLHPYPLEVVEVFATRRVLAENNTDVLQVGLKDVVWPNDDGYTTRTWEK